MKRLISVFLVMLGTIFHTSLLISPVISHWVLLQLAVVRELHLVPEMEDHLLHHLALHLVLHLQAEVHRHQLLLLRVKRQRLLQLCR